ncbi:MAG: HAD family hydrolase [Alphaproteobacteria bacterium]|nr:HAD family hydrolase [Alphaproteobacteria bacterium]OJV17249.1 MAG: hypothetical protein BGO27_06205 [Alphaproteobacteria bacterium 33-17]
MTNKTLLFDLDDTLVLLNKSREKTILGTLNYYFTGSNISLGDLLFIRKNYAEKDDLLFIKQYLIDNDLDIPLDALKLVYVNVYFEISRHEETAYISKENMEKLSSIYDLYIVSNRPREFYENVWNSYFEKYFKGTVCFGDFPDVPRKPDPAIILETIKKYQIHNAIAYIGNHPIDMIAAKNAKITPIGILTTHTAEALTECGANYVFESFDDLFDILCKLDIKEYQAAYMQ